MDVNNVMLDVYGSREPALPCDACFQSNYTAALVRLSGIKYKCY